jgi:hypothetical protein
VRTAEETVDEIGKRAPLGDAPDAVVARAVVSYRIVVLSVDSLAVAGAHRAIL